MNLLDSAAGLIALVVLEIILGIDNLVFLSILTEKLPCEQRKLARRWGLTFAWVTRLMLLASAVFLFFSVGSESSTWPEETQTCQGLVHGEHKADRLGKAQHLYEEACQGVGGLHWRDLSVKVEIF